MSSYNEFEGMPRESTESSSRGYKSRFHEHMSQAYTAFPPTYSLPPPSPTAKSPHKVPRKPVPNSPRLKHRHSPSVDSFTSISSTSSTSSFSRLKKFAFGKARSHSKEEFDEEFVIKGSLKTFRKEDIKVGGLTNSTVYFHSV